MNSRRAEADRLDELYRKYDLAEDDLPTSGVDRDVLFTFGGESVVYFTWDECDDDDIPEGTIVTSSHHACFCQPPDSVHLEQLDGPFDPEPWRYRSLSEGSDCSILDIRELCDAPIEDVEMLGHDSQPVVSHIDLTQEPPSEDGVQSEACPSASDGSLWQASCSMLRPQEAPNRVCSPVQHTSTISSETNPPRSPVYPGSMGDSPIYDPGSPSYGGASARAPPLVYVPEETAPLQLRLRNGKTLGLSRVPTFKVAWRGVIMTLYHHACYLRERTLVEEKPIKIVLTNACCLNRSIGSFPEALIIAAVGGK